MNLADKNSGPFTDIDKRLELHFVKDSCCVESDSTRTSVDNTVLSLVLLWPSLVMSCPSFFSTVRLAKTRSHYQIGKPSAWCSGWKQICLLYDGLKSHYPRYKQWEEQPSNVSHTFKPYNEYPKQVPPKKTRTWLLLTFNHEGLDH